MHKSRFVPALASLASVGALFITMENTPYCTCALGRKGDQTRGSKSYLGLLPTNSSTSPKHQHGFRRKTRQKKKFTDTEIRVLIEDVRELFEILWTGPHLLFLPRYLGMYHWPRIVVRSKLAVKVLVNLSASKVRGLPKHFR